MNLRCAALLACVLACSGVDPQPSPSFADVAYGTHARQVLDCWQAAGAEPTPVVVHIHGGGWVRGDKRPVPHLERYLAAGISVVSITYRFTQQAQLAGVQPPVQWPLQDAARAVQFVRTRAAEWKLDPSRVAATGGSAGACSSLWLAFHDDLAEPTSADVVARASTRLACVAVNIAQTTLDPQQMQAWTPNSRYGGHAFGLMDPGDLASRDTRFAEFLAARERLLPQIKAWSPWEHVSVDDPPVYLSYPAPPALGKEAKDPTHSANFGVKLQERLTEVKVPCELAYPGAPGMPHRDVAEFLIERLGKQGR